MSSSKRLVPDPILGVEEARCSIGERNGGFQEVQNWFTGIPNPSRSSRLRMRLPDFYRMCKVGVYPSIVPSFYSGDVN